MMVKQMVVDLKVVPRERAIVMIKDYINHHKGCRTSDIIYDLELDPDLVLSVLKELEKKKEIRGEETE